MRIKGFYTAKPTLNELYTEDPLLFNGLALPAGMDDTTARSVILQELGELQTVFPRAADCRAYIPIWCAANSEAWQRMYDALTADYNPIHNYDRTDTETETAAGGTSETESSTSADNETRSTTGTGSENYKRGEKETITDTQNSSFTGSTQAGGQDTTTRSRQGFNSATFVPADQDVVALGSNNNSTSATTGSGTQLRGTEQNDEHKRTNVESGTRTNKNDSSKSRTQSSADSRNRTLHSSGNIGVTTSQQMIESELTLRKAWTMYGIICEAFKRDFCVGVW